MLLNHFFYIFNISLSLPVCGSRSFFWWRKMRIPSPPRFWLRRLRTASLSCSPANTEYTCSERKSRLITLLSVVYQWRDATFTRLFGAYFLSAQAKSIYHGTPVSPFGFIRGTTLPLQNNTLLNYSLL